MKDDNTYKIFDIRYDRLCGKWNIDMIDDVESSVMNNIVPEKPDKVIEGKTKIITLYSDDDTHEKQNPQLVKVTTKDSLTGNDGELKSELPLAKAKTTQTCNVFNILKSYGIPCAYQTKLSDTEFLAKNCRMIPLECVMRRRPWGSYLKRHNIRDPENVIFKSPIAEFYLKVVNMPYEQKSYIDKHIEVEAAVKKFTDPIIYIHYDLFAHDALHAYTTRYPMAKWYLHPPKEKFDVANLQPFEPAVVDYETIQYIEHELMRPTFRVLEDLWKKFGISLIDLKIEVGYTITDDDSIGAKAGELVIADVIDNDSWRIWPEGDPTKQLDKQLFREGGDEDDVVSNYEKVADYTYQMKEWYYRI